MSANPFRRSGPAAPGVAFESMRFDDVSHHYTLPGNTPLPTLSHVSFAIRAHEFVTILGPSGCGKSTLFNLASGLISTASGTVELNGQPIATGNPFVAYMFQRDNLLEWRSVLDNAVLGMEFLGTPKRLAREKAMQATKLFGLDGFEGRRPHELSGGMRQRVALLRTYLTNRDLLLLDEPFGSLDSLTRLRMQEFLLDRWEHDNRTVLFITHDVDEAILLGDRVVVLTARPAAVKAELEVGIPRPRGTGDVTTSDRFVELKRQILDLIHSETEAGQAGDEPALTRRAG